VLQKARVKGDNIVFFTKTGAAAAEMATATALAATGVLTTTSRKRERADEADF
jgi:4-aminobutyrate aminotransferase-like enzyme